MTSRRGFLQGLSTVGLLACTGDKSSDSALETIDVRPAEPEKWSPGNTLSTSIFPSGIQVGDASSSSAFVSVQTTADSVEWILVHQNANDWVEIARNVEVAVDGTVQFSLTDLLSDTAHCIVCIDQESQQRSAVTRFRTALGDTDWRIVTFGATSCMRGNLPWSSLTRAAEEQLDFFLLLGDTVYTNARSFDTAWSDWQVALRVQGLQDLTQSTSVIATWDDHELVNNFDWDLVDGAEEIHANALRAFQKALPMDQAQTGKVYRKISHGDVCDIFVLDCRGERRSDSGQYMSSEQLQWLKSALTESTARFKFIMNSVPITDFNDLIGEVESIDRWQGFPEQRTELLSHIEDSGIQGVLWLAGDFHFGLFAVVSPVGQVGDSMFEVLNGPTGSFLNPMGELLVPTEQFQFTVAAWNYTHYECNPQTGEVLVRYIADDGSTLREQVIQL